MKTAAITGAVVAALAAGAVATPSFAQDYRYYDNGRDPCHQSEHNRGTTGAVVGGIAGAVIGSNIPRHHGARAGGAILGGLAGAAIGNSIGRGSAKSTTACSGTYGYYDDRYYNGQYDGRYGYNDYNGYNSYSGDYSRPYSYSNGYYDSYGYWHPYR